MNRYPLGKFFLLLAVLLVSGLYALPNLYPDVPAIQITRSDVGQKITGSAAATLRQVLEQAGIAHDEPEVVGDSLLIRMHGSDDQLRARALVSEALGRDYQVALNLAPTTPGWLRAIGASPMGLGLDLRGGVHFTLQVDMETAINQRLESWAGEIRIQLRDAGIRYREVRHSQDQIVARFDSEADVAAAEQVLRGKFNEFSVRRDESGRALRFTVTPETIQQIQDYAIDQNRTALNNRVNELGVASPVVQRQGADRIVVQLPGVQDASQARRILGRTATLEFRMVADDVDPSRIVGNTAPAGTELYPFKAENNRPVLLRRQPIVTGDQVTNASMGFDPNSGQAEVNITLDSSGARVMERTTAANLNRPMAVLFIETRTDVRDRVNEDGETVQETYTYRDAYVINVANIRGTFGARFRITGLDSPAEAGELALLLRAGGLAAPMYIAEERTIGPSLGAANIEAGLKSMILGLGLVLVFMLLRYKLFGVFANVALLGNLVITVAIMSVIPGVTMTLPGIAGIVLSLGMAVDANVLIYERVRMELRDGVPPLRAIDAGYDRAFVTILDANLTTLIVAVVLFAAGSATVQGFAVTLFIGILTSMFTAIVGTRGLANLVYGRRQRPPAKISI